MDNEFEHSVAVELDAEVDAVWQAITTAEGLAEWIGDGSTIGTAPGDELDFNDVATGERRRGFLDEVTPNRRIGYTWWSETDPDAATRVAISLEPSRAGTRVTVVESRPMRTVAPSARSGAPTASLSWHWRLAMLTVGVGSLVGAG